MMSSKFSYQVQLYEKTYTQSINGGRAIEWKSLGKVWAHLTPYAANASLWDKRMAYDMVVQSDPRIFKADKAVWKNYDHFFIHAPQQLAEGYLKLRMFSWGRTA